MRWGFGLALFWALVLATIPGAVWAAGPWDDFQILMWQERNPVQRQGLRALGFTGVKLRATGGEVDATGHEVVQRLGLSYYLENLATDFYSPYHRYTTGKNVTWLFDAVRERRLADSGDPSVTVREPGLADPAWLDAVAARLERVVRAEAGGRPLFYNMADESGIADLAAAWDFDTGPASLSGFRSWLQSQYRDIAALNDEWGTEYRDWDSVRPEMTDGALRRSDQNFAAWGDFKAWMDVSFVAAVQKGTDAIHRADRLALAGLEGAQVPGWGGYDYALLAPAVDVMEIYDFGEALDLALAFHPDLIPLRTSFGVGPRERHAAWRFVLHGGRCLIVWDERDDVVAMDGGAGPRGLEIADWARAVAPVASLLRAARPEADSVAILYSQASFRVQWLLDRQAGDRDWAARDAEREYDDNAWRASRRVLVRKLAELAVQPRFLSTPQLAAGALREGSIKTLFLPHAIALSDAELAEISQFEQRGGIVVTDGEVGVFDGHGRRRVRAMLPDLPHPQAVRLDGEETVPASLGALSRLLAEAPRVQMFGPDGELATGVEARWFRSERGLVLALQAGRPWGAPPSVALRFPRPVGLIDVRHGGAMMSGGFVPIDPIEPTILAGFAGAVEFDATLGGSVGFGCSRQKRISRLMNTSVATPEIREKLWSMMKGIQFAMLTTEDGDYLRARPMAASQQGFDGALWFFTRASSHKVAEVGSDQRVGITYADSGQQNYVSLSGKAVLVTDKASIEAHWSEYVRTWFPKGENDPDIALLRVTIEAAEYWDAPNSTMVHAYGYVKAILTGEPPHPGENKKVSFS